jgi:hypothetical protein
VQIVCCRLRLSRKVQKNEDDNEVFVLRKTQDDNIFFLSYGEGRIAYNACPALWMWWSSNTPLLCTVWWQCKGHAVCCPCMLGRLGVRAVLMVCCCCYCWLAGEWEDHEALHDHLLSGHFQDAEVSWGW